MQPASESKPKPSPEPSPAVEHVEGAHQLLKALQERIGKHPELGEAILKLEMALNTLTIKTGAML
ncbi:MAG: hypothetical protein LAO03_02975 [Acidobacteriia bacterium]|nr:hypothetical protein [Terriglobia bacterium]